MLFHTSTYPFVNMLNNHLFLNLDHNQHKYKKTKEEFNINLAIYSHLFYLLSSCFVTKTDENLDNFIFNKDDFIVEAISKAHKFQEVKLAMTEFNLKVSFHNVISINMIKGAFDDMRTIYNYLNDEVLNVAKYIEQTIKSN